MDFSMMRPFSEADFDACVTLYIATFAGEPWNETWSQEVVAARLRQMLLTPGFFGVVIDAGGINGFALGIAEPWHEGSHFYLKEMCIHPSLQRRGLGKQLLQYLSDQIQETGSSRIYLLTARDGPTESFYAKAGFYTSPRMILMARRFELSA